MNSCIYIISLSHERLRPRKNSFRYSIYMMYFDLDELEFISNVNMFFSYNKWNIFSFHDKDHFKFLNKTSERENIILKENIKYNSVNYENKNTKERIVTLAKEVGVKYDIEKVFVLTNVRNLGYIFNPVSFYYCYDKKEKLRVMFSEVNNTFGDQKMYYSVIENPEEVEHSARQKKNYYISPFISYDNDLCWRFREPNEKIFMAIDSINKDGVELKTVLGGKRRDISNLNFIFLFFRYPMVTVMVIFLIHYQALRLWIKNVKFYRKEETDEKIVKSIGVNK